MTDPKRWLEDEGISEGVRQLLEAGDPPPNQTPATQAQLTSLAQGLVAQGTLSAVSGSLLGTKAIVGAAAIGLAATVGVASVTVFAPERAPLTAEAPVPESAPVLAPAPPRSSSPPQPPSKQRAPRTSPSIQRPVTRTAPSSSPASPVVASAPSASVATFDEANVAAEARLLGEAQAALSSAPTRALELTEEHARVHPGGQLAAEREVIAIDALQRLGRHSEARRRAAPLLAAPDSAYSRRVERILGEAR